jgi:prepilin-type N-terminal cleavage/methylation domain-containing protein
MLAPHTSTHQLRAEHGFTLMETLVAMVAGLLISLAAFTFLQIAVDQTSRATDYVQASQLGRTAMTHIVDELNSACLKSGFSPVQEGSTTERLIFVDAFSKEAEIPDSQIQKHELVWEKEPGEETGKLTDVKSTAKEDTEYTWGSPTNVKIGTRIGKDGSEPIFRYYEYGTEAKNTPEAGVSPFKEIPLTAGTKLTLAQAENVASVQVAFRALPTDGKAEETLGRSLDLRSQVTFAFSAPIAEPTITDEPCE